MTTKEKILDSALDLFSKKGYEAVSVAQIADAVGIKAPSLYKHYKSKQDIFDAILKEMNRRYQAQAESMQMDGENAEADFNVYQNVSEETLIKMGKELFLYFLRDEYNRKFRKMLTVEQYQSSKLSALYSNLYFDGPIEYQGAIFSMLSASGNIKAENPKITAMHFYAPIYMLLCLCDRAPEREAEALIMLEEHIKQFNRLYRTEDNL